MWGRASSMIKHWSPHGATKQASISLLLNVVINLGSYCWHVPTFSFMAYLMISCTATLSNFVYHYKKLLRIFLNFQTKFDKDAVRDIIRYAIKENVGTSQQYDKTLITTWSNELMEACLVALTKLQKPFKYIGMILKFMRFSSLFHM